MTSPTDAPEMKIHKSKASFPATKSFVFVISFISCFDVQLMAWLSLYHHPAPPTVPDVTQPPFLVLEKLFTQIEFLLCFKVLSFSTPGRIRSWKVSHSVYDSPFYDDFHLPAHNPETDFLSIAMAFDDFSFFLWFAIDSMWVKFLNQNIFGGG